MSPLVAFTIALATAIGVLARVSFARLSELQDRIADCQQLHTTLADHTRRISAIERRVQALLDQQKEKPATGQSPPEPNLPFPPTV